MNAPPPELAWIAIIGGAIGIFTSIVNLIIIWRNRRRIEFRVVSATVYAEPWKIGDFPKDDYTEAYKKGKGKKLGGIKRAFVVVEFSLKNSYPYEITIGRFMIDRWMFSDRYHKGGIAYPLNRDYRVFDLYTREPTNLESYARIPSKATYALRLEILEDTHTNWSSHGRYIINLPKNYVVEFLSEARRFRNKIRLRNVVTHEYFSIDNVHHWSDLLPEVTLHGGDEARPQGLKIPDYRLPWRIRLQHWSHATKNRLLYGTPYHAPKQVSRVSKLRGIIRKR